MQLNKKLNPTRLASGALQTTYHRRIGGERAKNEFKKHKP
jgi:hypothetical protein